MTRSPPTPAKNGQLPRKGGAAPPAGPPMRHCATNVNERDNPGSDEGTSSLVQTTQDSGAETRANTRENTLSRSPKMLDYSGKVSPDLPIIERKGMGGCPVFTAGSACR